MRFEIIYIKKGGLHIEEEKIIINQSFSLSPSDDDDGDGDDAVCTMLQIIPLHWLPLDIFFFAVSSSERRCEDECECVCVC